MKILVNLKNNKLKRNILIKSFFVLITLTALFTMLHISYNIDEVSLSNSVIAAITDQSSTTSKRETDQSSINNSGDMVDLLARLINGEARGEPYKGQVAVGAVVMNRVKSSEFPDTISGVIYQKGQFSCVTDGQFDKAIDKNSTVYKAAREALNGADPTNGCVFFYNPKTTKSKWLYTRTTVITIGSHRFAK